MLYICTMQQFYNTQVIQFLKAKTEPGLILMYMQMVQMVHIIFKFPVQWRIQGRLPPTAQKFLDFMQFLGNFDKVVCWRLPPPPPEGRRPLLRGILDQPLQWTIYVRRLIRRTEFVKCTIILYLNITTYVWELNFEFQLI